MTIQACLRSFDPGKAHWAYETWFRNGFKSHMNYLAMLGLIESDRLQIECAVEGYLAD